MRIAFEVGPIFSRLKNGIPSYSFNLAAALSKKIDDTSDELLLTDTFHFLVNFGEECAALKRLIRPGVKLRGAMPGWFEAAIGLSWIPLAHGNWQSSFAGRLWNWFVLRSRAHPIRMFQWRLRNELRKSNLDLIHVTSLGGSRTGLHSLASRTRCITLHDTFHLVEPGWFTGDMVQMLNDTLEHARNYDAVFTVSNASRDDLINRAGFSADRVHVVYNGIDPAFSPAPGDAIERVCEKYGIRNPYLLAVGVVEPRKNLKTLISAFENLGSNYKDLQLVLTGGDGWRIGEALRESCNPRIVRTGQVPFRDLVCLYTGATAFCFPSLYEGFGLPVLEAMACGCPVIASDTSSLPEIAGDAALMVPPRDVDAWTSAIRKVLDDEDLRQRMQRTGYDRAKLFSWENAADCYLAHYRTIANLRSLS